MPMTDCGRGVGHCDVDGESKRYFSCVGVAVINGAGGEVLRTTVDVRVRSVSLRLPLLPARISAALSGLYIAVTVLVNFPSPPLSQLRLSPLLPPTTPSSPSGRSKAKSTTLEYSGGGLGGGGGSTRLNPNSSKSSSCIAGDGEGKGAGHTSGTGTSRDWRGSVEVSERASESVEADAGLESFCALYFLYSLRDVIIIMDDVN